MLKLPVFVKVKREDGTSKLKVVMGYDNLFETHSIKDIINPSEKICLETIKRGHIVLKDIENQTERICLEAVKLDGHQLEYVKEQTAEICLEAIMQNPSSLQFAEYQSEHMCKFCVEQLAWTIRFVKEQTEELCIAAVKFDGILLQYVKHQTPKICLNAVCEHGLALRYVKEQTEEICFAAVQQDGLALEYVENKTLEICLAAVEENGQALQFVEEQTPEICLAAVKENGYALFYVKDQTLEICLAAVRLNKRVIKLIRDEDVKKLITTLEQSQSEEEPVTTDQTKIAGPESSKAMTIIKNVGPKDSCTQGLPSLDILHSEHKNFECGDTCTSKPKVAVEYSLSPSALEDSVVISESCAKKLVADNADVINLVKSKNVLVNIDEDPKDVKELNMRKETTTISERLLMFAIAGQLFSQAPNRQPRNAEIIMTKVRDSFRKDAYNDNEWYTLKIESKKLKGYIKNLLCSIKEFNDLNLSQNEYEKNIQVDDPSRPKYSFCSAYDVYDSESWRNDFIDLDAFVGNVMYNIYMVEDYETDCFGCVSEDNNSNCSTCHINPDYKNKFESSRMPRGKYTFACKYDCYKNYYICCEECKDVNTCTRKCGSNSKECGQAINKVKKIKLKVKPCGDITKKRS